ncbi:hypothetical protein MY014_52560 [Escherichia coli]|nr:hypothetical protein MY014_52560 [Escherichia coli]
MGKLTMTLSYTSNICDDSFADAHVNADSAAVRNRHRCRRGFGGLTAPLPRNHTPQSGPLKTCIVNRHWYNSAVRLCCSHDSCKRMLFLRMRADIAANNVRLTAIRSAAEDR